MLGVTLVSKNIVPYPRLLNIADESYKIFIPEEYLFDFEMNYVENKPHEWIRELVEKEDRIPKALAGKEVVLDGYNEIDIFIHAFSLKKIYLRLIRRRWKEKGTTKQYSYEYDLRIPGMKTTKEFQDF